MKPLTPALLTFSFCASLCAQQAPPPPVPPRAGSPGEPSPPASNRPGKEKAVPSFLIVGTVFDEKALSFPGVQVRVRQMDEKKYRWETYTNSRGEFAVRVPPGYEYEVLTHVKKYKDQSKGVDGRVDAQQRLSIQLEVLDPGGGEKR